MTIEASLFFCLQDVATAIEAGVLPAVTYQVAEKFFGERYQPGAQLMIVHEVPDPPEKLPIPKPRALEWQVTCDKSNNPPSVIEEGKLVVTIQVKTKPGVNHYGFHLPIDLEGLEAGTLRFVPVVGRGQG